jgi:hypothetical protein
MKNSEVQNRIKKSRKEGVWIGLLIILLGALGLSDGYIREAIVTRSACHLLIFIGIFLLIFSLIRKINPKYYQKKYSQKICSNCSHVNLIKNLSESKCVKCNGELEEIEGFFDRHPEFTKKI